MLSKSYTRKSLPIAVKFTAIGDAIWSIVLVILIVFGAVGILLDDEDELQLDEPPGFSWLKLCVLGLLAAVHLWAAGILYRYMDNQRNSGLWQWFLVTAVIIIVFSRTYNGAIPEGTGGGDAVLFSSVTIVYKVFGAVVVAAFKKQEMRSREISSRSDQSVQHGNSRIP